MQFDQQHVSIYQPWSCDLCGEYGTVEAASDWDAGEIKHAAQEQHNFGSTCPGRLRFAGKWQLMQEPVSSTH